MYAQATPKRFLGCLTAMAVLALLLSFAFVRSFNPWRVYTSGGLGAKIVMTVIALYFAFVLMQFLSLSMTRIFIAKAANRPADDLVCPGCGKPLMAFAGVYRMPTPCPLCRTWWHGGPACYDKGRPPGPRFLSPCPSCHEEEEAPERELYRDLEA